MVDVNKVNTISQESTKPVKAENLDQQLEERSRVPGNEGPGNYAVATVNMLNIDRDAGVRRTPFFRAYPLSPIEMSETGQISMFSSPKGTQRGVGFTQVYYPIDPNSENGVPEFLPDLLSEDSDSTDVNKVVLVFLRERSPLGLYDALHPNLWMQISHQNALDAHSFGQHVEFFISYIDFLVNMTDITSTKLDRSNLPDYSDGDIWITILNGTFSLNPQLNKNKDIKAIYSILDVVKNNTWEEAIELIRGRLVSADEYPESHVRNLFEHFLLENYKRPLTVESTSRVSSNRNASKIAASMVRNTRDTDGQRSLNTGQVLNQANNNPLEIDYSSLVQGSSMSPIALQQSSQSKANSSPGITPIPGPAPVANPLDEARQATRQQQEEELNR